MEKTKTHKIRDISRKDKSILAVYIFGSQVKNKSNKYSDIDIAVLFDDTVKKEAYADKQIALITDLTKALNKEIDAVILNRAPLFLKYNILKEGIKIYERSDRNEHNFESQAIMQYFDFLPVKNIIEDGVLAKIKGA